MIRIVNQVVRIITFELQSTLILFFRFIIPTEIQDAIGVRRIPLHSVRRVIISFTLESGSEGNWAFFEDWWDIADSTFEIELIALNEQIVTVLRHRLKDGWLEPIDSIIEVSDEENDIWKIYLRLYLLWRVPRSTIYELAHYLLDIIVTLGNFFQAWMQMTIDADKCSVNEIKFDLDRALIAHHIFEAGGDEVSRHILN